MVFKVVGSGVGGGKETGLGGVWGGVGCDCRHLGGDCLWGGGSILRGEGEERVALDEDWDYFCSDLYFFPRQRNLYWKVHELPIIIIASLASVVPQNKFGTIVKQSFSLFKDFPNRKGEDSIDSMRANPWSWNSTIVL